MAKNALTNTASLTAKKTPATTCQGQHRHNDEQHKEEECNTECCPIDCEGEWTTWTEGECSASCDGGVQSSTRTFLVTREAKSGGKTCKFKHNKEEHKEEECNTECCPIDCEGEWTEWTEGECSASCDGGIKSSSRTFLVTREAKSGGKTCKRQHNEEEHKEEECNTECCPVDCEGEWSKWTEGECSASCDGGLSMLSRTFHVTRGARSGGKTCTYRNGEKQTEEQECNTESCPIDCLGEWEAWSTGECSVSCGGGEAHRDRTFVVVREASNGGRQCPHKHGDCDHSDVTCNTQDCPCADDDNNNHVEHSAY